MNLYKKSGIFAIALLAFSSCAVHDLFEENLELGQVLPTVTWELGSSVCRAGNDVTFLGKYYTTNADVTISHSEVWAMVTRSQSAAATLRLTSSLSYTKTVTSSDTVRSSQLIQSYDHSLATWNGYEYELSASFPTSQTLTPVSWVNPAEFDEERFNLYYPETFKSEFNETVVNYLTADSTYYNDLRHVYCNYDFTAEQFQTISANNGVTFPTETATDVKSDLWYTNLENVVGYYYNTIDGNGVATPHEVPTLEDVPAEYTGYEVYESSPWVFCRYSDDTGGAIYSIREAYKPFFKELMEQIPFEDWIFNSVDNVYSVEFSRSYTLIPQFKVVDTNGKIGMATDEKTVQLN